MVVHYWVNRFIDLALTKIQDFNMINETSRRAGRSGGRAARKASRAAPLAENMRPIRPGMQGGTYKPLSDLDMHNINDSALKALEEIGLADAPQSGISIMVGAGAILGDDGRLRYPRPTVRLHFLGAIKNMTSTLAKRKCTTALLAQRFIWLMLRAAHTANPLSVICIMPPG